MVNFSKGVIVMVKWDYIWVYVQSMVNFSKGVRIMVKVGKHLSLPTIKL